MVWRAQSEQMAIFGSVILLTGLTGINGVFILRLRL
jgi:hypothetical protein